MAITWTVSGQQPKEIRGSGFIKKNRIRESTLRLVAYFGAHKTKPYKLGHFYDDDIWLQLPEIISVLLSYLGPAAPHWTAHTIGCQNNRNGHITMPLSLKTKSNIVLVDHWN